MADSSLLIRQFQNGKPYNLKAKNVFAEAMYVSKVLASSDETIANQPSTGNSALAKKIKTSFKKIKTQYE